MAKQERKLIGSDLFPTKWSLFIFIAYMALFINQGILVTATKNEQNKYNYNTVTVVLFTECIKLIVATTLFLRSHSFDQLVSDTIKHKKVLLLYFVPALLYCFYNNLMFINLAAFDPTTYFLLLQFRVVVTGIIFQILFNKKLSKTQWTSLILLTIGCIIKQVHSTTRIVDNQDNDNIIIATTPATPGNIFNFNLVLILLQVFCSCFAGVYNEFLLKDVGVEVHLMIQNIFLYMDSIVCNILLLVFNGQLFSAFTYTAIKSVWQIKVLCVTFNSAAIGIVTSFFLASLNSILKTFASALELMFTAVLCWLIFGIVVDYYTIIAIAIVSYATYLYAQNPVVNPAKIKSSHSDETVSASTSFTTLTTLTTFTNGKSIETV